MRNSVFVIGVVVVVFVFMSVLSVQAKSIEASAVSISGTWNMVHDDWQGSLMLDPPDQKHTEIDGPCTYTYYVISGTYTGINGVVLPVEGRFGGRDPNNQTGGNCKQSYHLVTFTIAFPGQPPQPFTGYLFTHKGKTMAGTTWWQGIPFGWYAIKS